MPDEMIVFGGDGLIFLKIDELTCGWAPFGGRPLGYFITTFFGSSPGIS
jgi:hypothetical protein